MFKSKTARVVGFVGTIGASAALVGAAASSTGAYFSDSRTGGVGGNIGSIKVATSGGSGTDNLDFTFADMLPGELQSATATYTNTGRNRQDVWLVFPSSAAFDAVNTLGHYGEARIAVNGTEKFASTNLNGAATCPPVDDHGNPTDCAPLPTQLKLATVNAGDSGTVTYSFAFSGLLKGKGAMEQTVASLPFQIVATQVGKTPTDPNNTPNNLGH